MALTCALRARPTPPFSSTEHDTLGRGVEGIRIDPSQKNTRTKKKKPPKLVAQLLRLDVPRRSGGARSRFGCEEAGEKVADTGSWMVGIITRGGLFCFFFVASGLEEGGSAALSGTRIQHRVGLCPKWYYVAVIAREERKKKRKRRDSPHSVPEWGETCQLFLADAKLDWNGAREQPLQADSHPPFLIASRLYNSSEDAEM